MMFRGVDISDQLRSVRRKDRTHQDEVVSEARRILEGDLYSRGKVLQNLGRYERLREKIDEENVDSSAVFSLEEIRKIAIRQRLKFLPWSMYKSELPFEATVRIESLNKRYGKDLKNFFLMSYPGSFEKGPCAGISLLFTPTNYDNYFLVHQWGKKVPWYRSLMYWPMRRFESLLLTVIFFTLAVTLVLPTDLITLDSKAGYWSGYRAAAFFHLLIFNAGVTIYITLAFTRNLSSSMWNRKKDFD